MPEYMRVDSLDTISDKTDRLSYDELEEELEAQREWEESLEQLQQLFSIVLLPYLGKWLGRRWSHWGMFSTHAVPLYTDQRSPKLSLVM